MNMDSWSKEDRDYAQRCCEVDASNINGEFMRVSADLYYWRSRWVAALDRETSAAGARKQAWAETYQRMRVLKDAGAKHLTENAIDAAIEADVGYREVVELERQAGLDKAGCAAVIEAVTSKKEMIISLGANLRAEAEPLIRDREHAMGVRRT